MHEYSPQATSKHSGTPHRASLRILLAIVVAASALLAITRESTEASLLVLVAFALLIPSLYLRQVRGGFAIMLAVVALPALVLILGYVVNLLLSR